MSVTVPEIAESAYQRLKGIYAAGFDKELQQYRDLIEARMQSNKETPAAAMCALFNATDSKIIKAWLLAAAWDIESGAAAVVVIPAPAEPPAGQNSNVGAK